MNRYTQQLCLILAILLSVQAQLPLYQFAVSYSRTRSNQVVANFAPCQFGVEHALNLTINKYLNLTNRFQLKPVFIDDSYTNQGAVKAAFQVTNSLNNSYIAVLGNQLSAQCRVTANIYDSYQIPQISPSCGDAALSDKTQFPGFIRGVSVNINDGLVTVVKNFPIKRVAILALNNDYGILAAQVLQNGLKSSMELVETFLIPTNLTLAADLNFFNQIIKRQYRTFIYRGNSDQIFAQIIFNAQKLGLLDSNYLWLIGSGELSIINNLPLTSNQSVLTQSSLQRSRFLALRPQIIEGEMLNDFYNSFILTNYSLAQTVKQNGPNSLDWVTAHCHDLTLVLAQAVDSLLSNKIIPQGKNLTQAILQTQLYGISGLLAFDKSTYDRLQDLDLVELVFLDEKLQWRLQGTWFPLNNRLKLINSANYRLILPSDRPQLTQIRLSKGDQIVGIVLAIILKIVVITSIMLIWINRHKTFIKHCSPIFTTYYLLALLGFSCSIYPFILQPAADNLADSDRYCQAQPWIIGVFFIGFFAICLCKAVRMYLLFHYTFKEFPMLENFPLSFIWLFLIILEIVWNIIWFSGSAGSLWSTQQKMVGDPDQFTYQYVCGSDSKSMIGLWLGYKILFLILGAVMAFLTRSIDPRFNESQSIALNIYNIIILSSIGMGISTQLTDLLAAYYLRIFVIFILVISSITFQLGPKFYLLFFPPTGSTDSNLCNKFDSATVPSGFSPNLSKVVSKTASSKASVNQFI